jgi:hypothetical protein
MSTVPTQGCPVREQLLARFTRLFGHYNTTLVKLLDKMTVEEAINETKALFDACTEARKDLSQHERDHGCAVRTPK